MDSNSRSLLSPQWSGTPVTLLASDAAILERFLLIERAWLEALGAHGHDVRSTRDGLEKIKIDTETLRMIADDASAAGNPVVGFVQWVRTQLGVPQDAMDMFHRGLTSQDVLDTAMMMTAARVFEALRDDLVGVVTRLGVLATQYSDTECVTRTLSRHAEVSLLGFRFAGWAEGVLHALTVIDSTRANLPIQIGGAVGNRAVLGALANGHEGEKIVAYAAEKLGLVASSAAWHSNRIPVLEVSHGLTSSTSALGVIAHNVVALGRPEVGELVEHIPKGSGSSSAMPHKRNPVRSILSHSVSQRIPGIVAQIYAAATPVAERGEGQWNAEWEPLRELMLLAGAQAHHVRALVETLEVDEPAVVGNLAASDIPHPHLASATREQMQRDIHRVTVEVQAQTKGQAS